MANEKPLPWMGAYPAISLKKARVQRDKAKALVDDGIDSVQYRAANKSRQAEAAANTFEALALVVHPSGTGMD